VTGYRVDTAALADADVLLGETAAAARAALQVVRAAAGELLGSRWAGPAATGFRIGWAEWSAGMSALLDGLDAMAGALGSSGAEYAAIDAQVRTAVGQAAT
jgi:WXG100 family type VII secretion target